MWFHKNGQEAATTWDILFKSTSFPYLDLLSVLIRKEKDLVVYQKIQAVSYTTMEINIIMDIP